MRLMSSGHAVKREQVKERLGLASQREYFDDRHRDLTDQFIETSMNSAIQL